MKNGLKKMNIIFVEANAIFRDGFSIYLNSLAFVSSIKKFHCFNLVSDNDIRHTDLIIFDPMDDQDFQHLIQIRTKRPMLPFMIISNKERFFDNYLFAKRLFIRSFFGKKTDLELIIMELRRIQKRIFNQVPPFGKPDKKAFDTLYESSIPFSLHEMCVLHLIAKGKKNAEIAKIIGLSHRTIESHRRRIIEKSACDNIIPALISAIKHSYISIDFIEENDVFSATTESKNI